MICERKVDQGALVFEFSLERHVPSDHLLRAIDRFVCLRGASSPSGFRREPLSERCVNPSVHTARGRLTLAQDHRHRLAARAFIDVDR